MGARFAASGLAFFLVLGAAAAASGTSWGSFPTSATVEVWCAPSKLPAAPTYSATVPGFPTTIARLGPALPGCSPLTQGEIIVDGRLLIGCFSETTVMARGGDIVDSPVLLPLVTAILRCDRERDGLRYSNGPQHGDLHRHLVRLGRRSGRTTRMVRRWNPPQQPDPHRAVVRDHHGEHHERGRDRDRGGARQHGGGQFARCSTGARDPSHHRAGPTARRQWLGDVR